MSNSDDDNDDGDDDDDDDDNTNNGKNKNIGPKAANNWNKCWETQYIDNKNRAQIWAEKESEKERCTMCV